MDKTWQRLAFLFLFSISFWLLCLFWGRTEVYSVLAFDPLQINDFLLDKWRRHFLVSQPKVLRRNPPTRVLPVTNNLFLHTIFVAFIYSHTFPRICFCLCMFVSVSLSICLSVSLSPNIYIYIRGSLNKFPDFFRMSTFIDSTHMKLLSPSK